jgi:uncharacterized caspase-like protein
MATPLRLVISQIRSGLSNSNPWQALRRVGTIAAVVAVLVSVGVGAATADRVIAHARRQTAAPAVSRSIVIDNRRLALVVGNSNYPDADAPLPQPVNDARVLAAALRKQGFGVELVMNGSRDDLTNAIARLEENVRSDSIVLVFFSGYAVQSDGENYLIPIDATIWLEDDVRRDGVGLNGLLSELKQRGARVRLAIIDASRRNPYERRFRDYSHGLAPIEAASNGIVLSAAASDEVVDDTSEPNGVLVSELLENVSSSPTSAEELFDRTRRSVARVTRDRQIPIVSSALTDDVRFDSGPGEPKPSS